MTKLGCNMTNKVSHIAAKFGHLSSNTFGVYSYNLHISFSRPRMLSTACLRKSMNHKIYPQYVPQLIPILIDVALALSG